jgi:hypothetical protein
MKKLSLVLAAVVLSASISFAQDSKTAPATKGAATNNTDKGAKSTKSTKATKATPAKDAKPATADKK